MLEVKSLIDQIENNIGAVLAEDSTVGISLWTTLLAQHPADIALLIENLTQDHQLALLKKLPHDIAADTFAELDNILQALLLQHIPPELASLLLKNMPADELADLFDHLSDAHIDTYLKLLQKKQRNMIISLLNFNPSSAGGRMNSDVLTLQKDFTIKKSIDLLQRIGVSKDLTERIYVTNKENLLVGHITLEDLVFNDPKTPLSNILEKNELHVYVEEDQEAVAQQMEHYSLSSVPVVDKQGHFLGVITTHDVLEIIKEEESEDVYRMSGLASETYSYFGTPFWKLIWQRTPWLISLLLLQSVSSLILGQYNAMINEYYIITLFLTMLTGTGGNAGNQSATLVIRGLTTREITRDDAWRVIGRELGIAFIIASLLVSIAFVRVYLASGDILSSCAISLSLFFIVVTSMALGTMLPLFFERLNIDPAHSAAPFLATLMDILGVLIYCSICSYVLR